VNSPLRPPIPPVVTVILSFGKAAGIVAVATLTPFANGLGSAGAIPPSRLVQVAVPR